MIMENLRIINGKQTRAGQTHRCGDRVDEWEITTEGGFEVKEEVLLPVCFQLAHRTHIQTKAEWQRNHFDAAKYFSGYYELIRSPSGYRFVLVTPHAD